MDECVIACGLPHIGRGDFELSRREMTEIQSKVAGLRRFGAASLDMAFVASGRLDGYWERGLNKWDIAAGVLMVTAAGGVVSDADGPAEVLETGNVCAANPELHPLLLQRLKAAA